MIHPGQRTAEEGVGAQAYGIKESKDMSTYIAGNTTSSFGAINIWIFTAEQECCWRPGPHVCSEMRVEMLLASLVQKASFADRFSSAFSHE